MEMARLELATFRLSVECSNQLSYISLGQDLLDGSPYACQPVSFLAIYQANTEATDET